MQQHTNRLINETSPYLLQHAHNPVDWHPWNGETLEKANKEGRMLLVSIGYSACHWCHVMEQESFEDPEVAALMNKHFVCVKVDREERPDVDQVYMDAVQQVSGRGGWPLNCFALPDGRPVWGGTYFPREQWLAILEHVALLFSNEREKLERQAAELYTGILQNRFITPEPAEATAYNRALADEMANHLLRKIDHAHGGFRGAPKFPMPGNFLYLLRYHYYSGNTDALASVNKTLHGMARGGIFDQVGGGFSRYSVDDRWHIPHFEKMLYDNAQLVSLYSEAYHLSGDPLYKEIVSETLGFVLRELSSPEGGFYAALDADSEGEEGKYYVWSEEQFKAALGSDWQVTADYFGVGGDAYWEDGRHVLIRNMALKELTEKHKLEPEQAVKLLSECREKLHREREKRVRPGLDDKLITAWNALMLKAFVDAFRAFDQSGYLEAAVRTAEFLENKVAGVDGSVKRSFTHGIASIDGFLDDYAFLAQAMLALYEVTLDERWLALSEKLAEYAIRHFYDSETGMFWYTSDLHSDSIARIVEVTDNVIPSSLSAMARVLHDLGLLLEKPSYLAIAKAMLSKIADSMQRYPSAFTNWGMLYLQLAWPFQTVVVTGPEARDYTRKIATKYAPDLLFAGSSSPSGLDIMKGRWVPGQTMVYVCTGSECKMPVASPEEALELLSGKHEEPNSI